MQCLETQTGRLHVHRSSECRIVLNRERRKVGKSQNKTAEKIVPLDSEALDMREYSPRIVDRPTERGHTQIPKRDGAEQIVRATVKPSSACEGAALESRYLVV